MLTWQPFSGPTIPNPVPADWPWTFNGVPIGPPVDLPVIDRATATNQLDVDKSAAGFAQIAEAQGSQLITGIGPLQMAGGRLSVDFHFTHNYLESQGYPPTSLGVDQALQDFDQSIVQGGLGNLLDTPSVGLVNSITGTPITWRRVQAIMRGTQQRSDKTADYSIISFIFETPSPYWTNSDASRSTLLIGARG